MEVATISFDRFNVLKDEDAQARIRAARAKLGERAVLLCHHYQRADVYQHADLTGDSLKLAKLAAQTDAEYIVFCGVHFMAEVADILSSDKQIAILPDLAAGCSMADMANLAKVERCWRELTEVLGTPDETITRSPTSTRRPTSKPFAASTAASCAPPPTPPPSSTGPSNSAKRSSFSPTSTSAGGPATSKASRSTTWWCGIRTSNTAA